MLNEPGQDDIAGCVRSSFRIPAWKLLAGDEHRRSRLAKPLLSGSSKDALRGFTVGELLITITIVGILASLVIVNWPQLRLMTQRSTALNNMRAIGAAFHLFANEHDGVLPQRTTGATDRWPRILADYLDDIKVYAAVGDGNVNRFDRELLLSNSRNNTSYIMNGYNDVGAYQDAGVQVRITQISQPSQVILLGTPKAGSTHFYMDMLEGKNGNHVDVLNLELYDNGSNYIFADGSARFIKKADYTPRLWLVNPDFAIPGEPSSTP